MPTAQVRSGYVGLCCRQVVFPAGQQERAGGPAHAYVLCASIAVWLRRKWPTHPSILVSAAPPAVPFALQGIAGRGVSSDNGRLLAYTEAVWGTVAANYAGQGTLPALAAVACTAMGYATGIGVSYGIFATPEISSQHELWCPAGAASLQANCTSTGFTGGNWEVEVACAATGGEGGAPWGTV